LRRLRLLPLRVLQAFIPASPSWQIACGSSESREQLVQSIRSTLTKDGFEEWVGKHTVWNKGGAHVEWETSESGDLSLKIWAFGGKKALRDSQQIELELLRLATFHPEVTVLRVEPPPRTLE
jgi:hypothetical protein